MSFRDRLQQIAAGETWVEFSQKIGSNTNTVGLWDDEHLPSGKKLKAICAAYGVNLHWLMTGVGEPFPGGKEPPPKRGFSWGSAPEVLLDDPAYLYEYKAIEVPETGSCDPSEFDLVPLAEAHLSAGGGAFVLTEKFKGYYAFRKEWLRRVTTSPRHAILMSVRGESMAPTISENDVVLLDTGRRRIFPGKLYAIGMNDTIMIKRLEPLLRTIRVISDNRTEYPPYEAQIGDLRVIGQVIWYARELVQRE